MNVGRMVHSPKLTEVQTGPRWTKKSVGNRVCGQDFLTRELFYESERICGMLRVLWQGAESCWRHWRPRLRTGGSEVKQEMGEMTDVDRESSSEEEYRTAKTEVVAEVGSDNGTICKLGAWLLRKGAVVVPAEFAVVLLLSIVLLVLLLLSSSTSGSSTSTTVTASTTANVGLFASLAQAVSMSVSRLLAEQERTFSFGLSVSCTVICTSCGLTLYLFFLSQQTHRSSSAPNLELPHHRHGRHHGAKSLSSRHSRHQYLHLHYQLNNPTVRPYYLQKFSRPDRVLFPVYWTAILVDYTWKSSPFVHALSLAVAIKVLNYFHHYFYCDCEWNQEGGESEVQSDSESGQSGQSGAFIASSRPNCPPQKDLQNSDIELSSCSESLSYPPLTESESPVRSTRSRVEEEVCQRLESLEEDLLFSSSKVSIAFFTYFTFIRRLGSLVWNQCPIFTHFLSICGLFLGQLLLNKLSPSVEVEVFSKCELCINKHGTDTVDVDTVLAELAREVKLQLRSHPHSETRRRSGNTPVPVSSSKPNRKCAIEISSQPPLESQPGSLDSTQDETGERLLKVHFAKSHSATTQVSPESPRASANNRTTTCPSHGNKPHQICHFLKASGNSVLVHPRSETSESTCGHCLLCEVKVKDCHRKKSLDSSFSHHAFSHETNEYPDFCARLFLKENVCEQRDKVRPNWECSSQSQLQLRESSAGGKIGETSPFGESGGGPRVNGLSSPPTKRIFRSGSQCLVTLTKDTMRRTSLPAALPAQRLSIHQGSGGVDTALLYEAHGLVTEMLLDQATLPPNIVAGLKALATLLKPTPTPIHYTPRARPAPLTLSTDPDYTSDVDEIPYTGEKLSSMPKRNSGPGKKGVSANLLRRMSTSTWTTTTSATGMPTLEPQPHARRRRSASFRSAMEGTPGSSPTQQFGLIPLALLENKENAKSPSFSTAFTNFKLGAGSGSGGHGQFATGQSTPHIPNAALQASHKARSFSAFALNASTDSRRRFSQQEYPIPTQRKTVCSLHPLSPSDLTHLNALATGIASSTTGVVKSASASVSAAGSNRSSPVGTPTPSPIPSPVPSRDPSPCNYSRHQQSDSSGPTDLPRSSLTESGFSGFSGFRKPSFPSLSSTNLATPSVNPPSNTSTLSSDQLTSRLRDYSPPKVIFQSTNDPPESFSVNEGDSLGLLSGKNLPTSSYLDNPDEDCSNASTLGDGPGPPDSSSGNSNSVRLSPVTFTLQEPTDNDQEASPLEEDYRNAVVVTSDGVQFHLPSIATDTYLCRMGEWDYPIFDLERSSQTQILSHMCYKVFLETGLFETFKIPIKEFVNFFHALALGYRDKPYHNRMHAADVLQGVFYFTTQSIPGFQMNPPDPDTPNSDWSNQRACFNVDEASYGIMGANFPALELMALYTAAAMHDYDHPGRTNAFLVTTHSPQAILYNDRSVLENHHAAAAWGLLLNNENFNFLKYLDKAEFKRFRFLVIESILATDLKRHFEIVSEFNSKVNEEESPGIDWTSEADRLLVMEICIKLADINGPCKYHDIHVQWTYRIAEEFYEQGDEEVRLGLPISPFMDRYHPKLAKLQESFISNLVAPLCKAYAEAGLLPGYWEDDVEDDQNEGETTADELSMMSCQETDNENEESSYSDDNKSDMDGPKRKIFCLHTKHLQDNHRYWMNVIKEEAKKKEEGVKTESVAISTEDPMETIEEENNTPHSLNRSFSFEKEDSKL